MYHRRVARDLQRDADKTQDHQHDAGDVGHYPVPEYCCSHDCHLPLVNQNYYLA
jgi:hypothetical protein